MAEASAAGAAKIHCRPKANVGIEVLENIDVGHSVVGEGGMSGRNEQRKLGTTRGSPRRSRTAKAHRDVPTSGTDGAD